MVHECLTECGTDPSDIHNVMSVFKAKGCISSQDSPRKIQVHQSNRSLAYGTLLGVLW